MDEHLKTTMENQIDVCKEKLELHKFKVDVVDR